MVHSSSAENQLVHSSLFIVHRQEEVGFWFEAFINEQRTMNYEQNGNYGF